MIKTLFNKYFELAVWITAMVSLALADPANQSHFSLCPLQLLGLTWCPGCGLGHSISFMFHGDIKSAFLAHWLGIPALAAILYRIFVLGKMRLNPDFFGEISQGD